MQFWVHSKLHIISNLPRGIDFQTMINEFQRKWSFPQCLGAIDSTRIPIKVPLLHQADYFNRKSFHSVILQVLAWHIIPGCFVRSQLGKMITEGRMITNDVNLSRVIDNHIIKPFLIGDPAYPLSKHLMKNYPGVNLILEKEHFNYRLSCAYVQVEKGLGWLKGRCRCLHKQRDCDPDKVVLHSYDSLYSAQHVGRAKGVLSLRVEQVEWEWNWWSTKAPSPKWWWGS